MKKTAIIIGASGEIGLETAKTLAKKGYNLALTYNKTKIKTTEIKQEDIEIKTYKLDLQNDDITSVFEQIFSDFKYVDTLVYCSGIAQARKLIFDVEDKEIDNLFDVNIKGAIKCIKHFTKKTVNSHPSNIILVGSFVEKYGCSCESIYTSTKSAMTGLCKSLAVELGAFGVRINVVSPGFIDTKMNSNLTQEEKTEITEMTPLQRLGTSQDVANVIDILCDEKSSFITGQTIYVDGGLILE